MENNILSIPFKANSYLKIDLENFIPCTQANFKKVLDTIDMSDIRDNLVSQLYDYLLTKLEECKDRVYIYVNNKHVKAADRVKKLVALKDLLVKRYSITEKPDAEKKEELPKLKRAIVYAFMKDRTIECFPGFTFEKSGYTFTVYKRSNGYYAACLYGVLIDGYCKSRNEAVKSVSDKIIDLLNNDPEKTAYFKRNFETAMIEAGYMTETETEIKPEAVKAADAPAPQVKADNEPIKAVKNAQSGRIKTAASVLTAIEAAASAISAHARQLEYVRTHKAQYRGIKNVALFRVVMYRLFESIKESAECAIGACMKSAIVQGLTIPANDPKRLAMCPDIRAGLAPMNGYARQLAINAGLSPPLKCAIGAGDM